MSNTKRAPISRPIDVILKIMIEDFSQGIHISEDFTQVTFMSEDIQEEQSKPPQPIEQVESSPPLIIKLIKIKIFLRH